MAENVTFPFPFKPYDVQEAFMKNLYNVLDKSQIGIFESPTGTGKSLSIICGALKWLKDYQTKQRKDLEQLISEKTENTEDDWFNSFLEKHEKNKKILDAKEEYKFLTEYEEKIKRLKNSKDIKKYEMKQILPHAKRRKEMDEKEENKQMEEDFVAEEYDSDDDDKEATKEEKRHVLKIYYASRTHSQLAQFLGEIQRSPYSDKVTVTTLGSRANFCINKSVLKLKNLSLINEQCVDMQKTKNSNKKCPFFKNLSDLQDNVLAAVRDIEDIVQLGQELKSCPYYATRHAIPDAEIVLLPYNVLLHKPTRDAYGIILKDNILIIDEAHNLVEAVNSMYSAEISGLLLKQTLWQMQSYLSAYQTRFSQETKRLIKLILQLCDAFVKFLSDPCNKISRIIPVMEFITLSDIGNINIFELVKYIENSLICQKVHGFTASRVAKGLTPLDDRKKCDKTPKISGTSSFLSQIKKMQNNNIKIQTDEVKENKEATYQYKPSAIFSFVEFLKTLTFPTNDGRVLIHKESSMENSSLKFLHLNPASHFQDIVKEARSIIVAGGTMQPFSEFTEQLFIPAGVSPERISLFSCGHVIPPENLLAIGLASGPCGNLLDFTFKSRQLPETVKELGSILFNVTNIIRGGIVCFFPSYDYEQFIHSELTKSKMLQSIEKKFRIFREPKSSSEVDKVLSEYAKCIVTACSTTKSQKTMSGAILFSVVGGKMSEGINFSDDLGRCVIMVGLPYPNKFSVELKEKMTYLNQNMSLRKGKNAGDVYYNNLCMKAVNQSIGRAIRHKNDYASIILLDHRYSNSSVKELLPSWIVKSLTFHQKFGPAYVCLKKFFTAKKE
ncbi:ATP-dependent DNA helicase DDX11-like [Argiope bruennichi]|uniref:ATP-dependent DNA helicase DDX11-like n=1 Tax=Argiope bruennichi TaxID=94029 RepID=UPI002494D73E|nr:ATP-dependent DNA helicase DDX11-like [Argiope bruennichi]XP_055952307.1 ATP-dependent DNA helicase DDX11-like [Argiope bruennichi]